MKDIKNRVLLRQLKKAKIKDFSSLNEENFSKLLAVIENTYDDMDSNEYRLERALELSTRELRDLNDNLEQKILIETFKNREKDQQLLEQSRTASMGEMIGNIAHQWRQPLSAITSTASGMLLQLQLGICTNKNHEDSYNKILEFSDFLTQTIEDFRNFFKEDKNMMDFELIEYMHKTINIIESSYKNSGIEIQHYTEENKFICNGYANEVSQVFLNILNNARDILVERDIEEKRVCINYTEDSEYYKISIIDNAGGIPENILPNIFDLYFTTKHKSQGTGIGLYMCKQIMEKNMKGKLVVKNRNVFINGIRYNGACFILSLPKIKT